MLSIEQLLLGAAILLLLGIIASQASIRLGVPALLLFLITGMLAGSEGPGGIYFDDAWLAQSLGVVALVLILFAGGLDTEWSAIRPILWQGLSLATVGVLITALLVGAFATIVVGLSWVQGLLLGAIVSSTDAAAVFAVMRARSVGLKGRLAPLIELESGSNDPMAVFLTLGFVQLIVNPETSVLTLVPQFAQQMVVGAGLGYGLGRVTINLVNRLRLAYEGLYPVLTLAMILLTYGATVIVGGNGFLAVYLAGLVMGNSDFIHKRSLMRFHDGLAWLMQIAMFLALGLLVFPSRLVPVIGVGLLVSAFLILVARPISVFMSLAFFGMTLREKALVAWVGLRGAAPIILATFPLVGGVPQADTLFNLVFFVVLTSVLIQGTSIAQVARWLGVDAPTTRRSRSPIELEPTANIGSDLVEVSIPTSSSAVGKQLVDLHLPREALIIMLQRENEFVVPRGATVLEAGDRLSVLADQTALEQVRAIVEGQS